MVRKAMKMAGSAERIIPQIPEGGTMNTAKHCQVYEKNCELSGKLNGQGECSVLMRMSACDAIDPTFYIDQPKLCESCAIILVKNINFRSREKERIVRKTHVK